MRRVVSVNSQKLIVAFFVTVIGFGSLVGPAAADFKSGVKAYRLFDFTTALGEFRPLAQLGHPGAQFHLGLMHGNGKGVKRDWRVAAHWFRQAAEQGHSWGQSNLGFLYATGQGVELDLVQAYKWYALAEAAGRPDDAKVRKSLAGGMTPEQLKSARRLAREWRPKRRWTSPGTVSQSDTSDAARPRIQAVQRQLTYLGYELGKPDGALGRKTLAAIRAFQKQVGMEPDGIISTAFESALISAFDGL